jgi:hypothetical protein
MPRDSARSSDLTTRRATASVSEQLSTVAIARCDHLRRKREQHLVSARASVPRRATGGVQPRPATAEPSPSAVVASAPRMKWRLTNRTPCRLHICVVAVRRLGVVGRAVAEEPVDVHAPSSGTGHTTMSSPTLDVGESWPFVGTRVRQGHSPGALSPPVELLSCGGRCRRPEPALTTPTRGRR